MQKEKGITLIEILVVAGISTFIVINLLGSFLKNRTNIAEVARIVISDIRTAQANSLASKRYLDPITGTSVHRCGYGIVSGYVDSNGRYTSYSLYVGRLPSSTGCPNNWQFNPVQDTRIIYTKVLDSRLEISNSNGGTPGAFNDITFEPYNASIRIENQHQPGIQNNNLSEIAIKKIGANCPSRDCIYICVYSFGRISMRTDMACPLCQGSNDTDPAECQQW